MSILACLGWARSSLTLASKVVLPVMALSSSTLALAMSSPPRAVAVTLALANATTAPRHMMKLRMGISPFQVANLPLHRRSYRSRGGSGTPQDIVTKGGDGKRGALEAPLA